MKALDFIKLNFDVDQADAEFDKALTEFLTPWTVDAQKNHYFVDYVIMDRFTYHLGTKIT